MSDGSICLLIVILLPVSLALALLIVSMIRSSDD